MSTICVICLALAGCGSGGGSRATTAKATTPIAHQVFPTRAESIKEANALCVKLEAQALERAHRAGATRTLRTLDQIFRIDAGLMRRYVAGLQAMSVPGSMRAQIKGLLEAARAVLRADEHVVAAGRLNGLAQSRSAAIEGQHARERLRAALKTAGLTDCTAQGYARTAPRQTITVKPLHALGDKAAAPTEPPTRR